MSRRKQARPRFVKHGELNADESDVLASGNMDNGIAKNLNNKINKNGALDSDKSLTETNLFEENNETDEYDDEADDGDDDNDVSRVGDAAGAVDDLNKIKVDVSNPDDPHNPNVDEINYGDDDDADDGDKPIIDDDLLGSPYSENDNSLDSFCSDLFSSHTSSSFSPSLSDGIATPNSLIHDNESSVVTTNGTSPAVKTVTTQLVNSGHRGHHRRIKNNNNNNNIDVGKTTTDKDGKGDGNYNCPFCDKSFPRLGYLKKHEQSHAEHMPFKCEFCARLFKHKRSRDRHTKLHTGDRRYRCPHCEAAFSRSDHLKIHMKTHDNQKPFQCTVCNRGYNTAAALTSHMQNHKKQAALLGSPSLNNYSPRSTGSTGSSTASSTQKRKYSSIPLHLQHQQQQQLTSIGGNHPLDYTNNFMKKYTTAGRINCLYCTKTDFVSMDKLHQHMEAMHGGIIRNEQLPHTGNTPNLQLSCEFCTMKFSSVQVMFHHLKSTHLDRMSANSPNGFLSYFGRNFGVSMDDINCHSLFKSPSNEDCKKLEFPSDDDKKKIDLESDTTSDIRKSPIIPNIKQESMDCELPQEQDVPTDLSQPKSKRLCTASPNGRGNEQQIEKLSPIQPMKLSPPVPVEPPAFLCNQCNAALPDFDGFRAHLKSHLEQGGINNSFLCQHCGITFTEQATYESHVASHFLISSVEYSCTNSCNKAFQKPDDLQKHLFESHSQILYKCNICSELFETKVAIQVHFAVGHSNEIKIYRCSACMEVYRTDNEFRHHIRTRHTTSGAVQCIFCRTICSSELEMHFHLAAHARQYRCPACPESFHVEFLLDRHMQTHHSSQQYHNKNVINNNNNNNSIVKNNNISNNNILDYQQTSNEKNLLYNFSGTSNLADKLFNPLQLDTIKHHQQQQMARNIYDVGNLGKRISTTPISGSSTLGGLLLDSNKNYQNANKNLIGLYNPVESMSVAQKLHNLDPNYGRFHNTVHDAVIKSHLFDALPSNLAVYHEALKAPTSISNSLNTLKTLSTSNSNSSNITPGTGNSGRYCITEKGYSCGICERNDFSTESEVHNHRKVVHNIKTGVSLRCAYCNGDFRSRSELENHMKLSHNTSGKHKCLICDEIFPSPAVLAEHKLSHCKVGASGKCSNCMALLPDVLTFKGHLSEHNEQELPVQCICCRQTLNSEFEISLHAKFHTKTSESSVNTCALCLEPLPSTNDTKICENCYKKRNFSHPAISSITGGAQQQMQSLQPEHLKRELTTSTDVRCNLCKKNFPTAIKLQEHLIEHTFAGCEDRGYICFICSSVFTAPGGLQNHIVEHGLASRPYDCTFCTAKFFFRAELDHHMVEHESVSSCKEDEHLIAKSGTICEQEKAEIMQTGKMKMEENLNETSSNNDGIQSNHSNLEEDEHIEVEKLPKDEKLETNLNHLSENNPTNMLTNGNVGNSE